jgi:hypothetical protein
MKCERHVARMGHKKNACRILMGRPEGQIPLGRPRCRWLNNFKIDLRDTGLDGMAWIDLAQDRVQRSALVNTVMNLRVPLNA